MSVSAYGNNVGQVDGAAGHRGAGGRRLVRPTALGLFLAGLWLLLGPAAPATAHAILLDSSPAEGQVVSTAPDEIVLTFNEPVRPVPERIMVIDPNGQEVEIAEPHTEDTDLIIPLAGSANVQGTYLVSYRIISADSHPVGGGITFSVGVASQTPEVPDGRDASDPVLRTAMSTVRYVGYAGLVLVIGPALMLGRLWPQRLSRRRPVRLLWIGMGLIAVSTVAGLLFQGPYSTGAALADLSVAHVADVLDSTFGQAHLVRLAALVAAIWLLRPLLRGRADLATLIPLAALGLVALGTWPASGHPVASPLPIVSMAVAMVHLAAAAFWVGGLVMLVGFLLRRANERELGAILPVWSGWAAAAVSALLVAGVVQTVIEVGSTEALVGTTYGQMLLAKVGLVAVVIALAVYSRRLVRRRIAAARPAPLRITVAAEAVLLAVVIAASAALVQTTPARIAIEAGDGPAAMSEFTATLETDLYSLLVTLDPGELGGNTLHLYSFTPDGEQVAVLEWGATAALPAAGIEPIDISLLRISDNHALGELSLPVAGDWEFRITARTSEVDQASVSVTVPIE